MDPQACLARLFELVNAEDTDSYYAFEDLANWLIKGGFPPVLNSLEEVWPSKKTDGARKICHGRPVNLPDETGFGKPYYTIQVKDHNNKSGKGPYEFCVYKYSDGDLIHRFDLPMDTV